ncbi:MAG TPA: hypothetical protein VK358_07600 [Longimicrobium sp.]|nr:hypothetical protein [Longimicrobium sp.]
MAAVHLRTLCAAAPALLALTLAACDGGDAPAKGTDAVAAPAPGAGGGVALGTVPPLPPGLPAPYLSGVIPTEVPARPDSAKTPDQSRPWFDVFSWQSFIALNWPASQQGRGNAQSPADSSAFLNMQNGALVVWGSYKETGELFGQGSARPTAFDDWNSAVEPCGGKLANGQKAFTFTSKGNSLFNDAAQSFSWPLVDQQHGYARYEVRYNRAQYDTIRGPDGDNTRWVYLSTNLRRNTPFVMPASTAAGNVGAIMTKAAWRPLTAQDDTSKFFRVTALVANDSAGQQCSEVLMGLVGLHIAQKVDAFPQWVWSSFEHVSNVPGTGSRKQGTGSGYSYNNGLDTPQSVYGWSYRPDTLILPPNAPPVQVTRVNDIPGTPAGASTQDINNIYQAFLQNTVWSNYQLVITQWPSQPKSFVLTDSGGSYPQDAGAAFPVWGAVNSVIETYMQTRENASGGGGNSCMSCHYQAGNTDFSWGLRRRAHP